MAECKVKSRCGGFTLAELIIALMVTGIVMAAVGSFATAISQADDLYDQSSRKQAEARYATFRIQELLRLSKLVCGIMGDDLILWTGDENGDGGINIPELVWLEAGTERNRLRVLRFENVPSWLAQVKMNDGHFAQGSSWNKYNFSFYCSLVYIPLVKVKDCRNVSFHLSNKKPMLSESVAVSWDVVDNGVSKHYEINGTLRGRAGYLVSDNGQLYSSDDDDEPAGTRWPVPLPMGMGG